MSKPLPLPTVTLHMSWLPKAATFKYHPHLPAQKASKLDSAVNMVQKQTENEILFLIKK